MLKLWSPHGKKNTVAGIVCSAEGVADAVSHHPAVIRDTLRTFWAPVFGIKPTDGEAQRSLLIHCPRIAPDICRRHPGIAEVEQCLRHARPSAPGPDGIPYSAWLFAGALCDILYLWLAGGELPFAFRDSPTVFPGKDKQEGDIHTVCTCFSLQC